MSTLATNAPARTSLDRSGSGVRTVLTAAAVIGALGSAGYIAGLFLLADMSTAEAQSSPITIVECLLTGLAYVAAAVALPSLAGVTRLPRWALSLAAAGCTFIAIQAWGFATLVADLANKLPADQFEDAGNGTLLMQLFIMPTGLFCLVGFVSLAITGWRRKAMSRGACVLLVLAGLVSLLGPFPPVGLLAGLAHAWTARSARPAEDS